MAYTFEILGVAPILYFFTHQQTYLTRPQSSGVAYLGAYECTLDAILSEVEQTQTQPGWDTEQAIQTVINFWMTNIEPISHWKQRLEDAGQDNLLMTRLADVNALKLEFNTLLRSS